MTPPDQGLALKEYEANVQQAVSEFVADDGLELQVHSHSTHTGTGGYLEIVGRSTSSGGLKAFAYRAAQAELEAQGDSWFTRKALRSLNDMHRAGHLPPAEEGKIDHQTLKPAEEYRDDTYQS